MREDVRDIQKTMESVGRESCILCMEYRVSFIKKYKDTN